MRAHIRIVEGEKERVQVFEGIAIRLHGGGVRETVDLYARFLLVLALKGFYRFIHRGWKKRRLLGAPKFAKLNCII